MGLYHNAHDAEMNFHCGKHHYRAVLPGDEVEVPADVDYVVARSGLRLTPGPSPRTDAPRHGPGGRAVHGPRPPMPVGVVARAATVAALADEAGVEPSDEPEVADDDDVDPDDEPVESTSASPAVAAEVATAMAALASAGVKLPRKRR